MPATKKPTEKQIAALNNFGVTAPVTKSACKNLLSWLLDSPLKKGQRVALLKAAQQKYLGKRVSCEGGEKTGTVRHVLNNQVSSYLNDTGDTGHNPLDAMIEWDTPVGSKKSVTRRNLRTLTILPSI